MLLKNGEAMVNENTGIENGLELQRHSQKITVTVIARFARILVWSWFAVQADLLH